jgi:hypothetical protein
MLATIYDFSESNLSSIISLIQSKTSEVKLCMKSIPTIVIRSAPSLWRGSRLIEMCTLHYPPRDLSSCYQPAPVSFIPAPTSPTRRTNHLIYQKCLSKDNHESNLVHSQWNLIKETMEKLLLTKSNNTNRKKIGLKRNFHACFNFYKED